MNKSLFQRDAYLDILGRINRLTPESAAIWGKMTVAQMLAHCQKPVEVATGDLKLKRGLIGILFGSMTKKKMTGTEPFSKNLPTDPNFKIAGSKDFYREKNRLVALLNQFVAAGKEGITKDSHPFFGKMSIDEWDVLLWKHLDHHLRQFGV
jgi:hypothetical protein